MKIGDLQHHYKPLTSQELHLLGGTTIPSVPPPKVPTIPSINIPRPSVAIAVDVKNLIQLDVKIAPNARDASYKYAVVSLVGAAAAASLGNQAIANLNFKLP